MTDKRSFNAESRFYILKRMINSELDDIKSFINDFSEYLNNGKTKIEEKFGEGEYDISTFLADGYYKYDKVYPKNYYNPLLLSIYGLFENWLKKICDIHSKKGFTNVKVKDLAGFNFIEKSRKYLSIVAELNLDDTEHLWQKIKQIQKVRNAIAHNNSNIKTDKNRELKKQDLYPILKHDKRIKLNTKIGSFYINDKEYLFEVISLIKEYLEVLITKL